MKNNESPAKSISMGLGTIFERIGDFFHIFDLSFFVGGSATLGAIVFLYVNFIYYRLTETRLFLFPEWVAVPALIISAYLCGLIAFAAGRELSGLFFRSKTLATTLIPAIGRHRLTQLPEVSSYIQGDDIDGQWKLYIRMWSEIVHDTSAPLLVHHLMRYWAMAATYDSVGFSLIVWAISLLILWLFGSIPVALSMVALPAAATVCLLGSYIAFRRGAQYYEYQIEDVVAHFAVKQKSLTTIVETPVIAETSENHS